VSSDGATIASGSDDRSVRLWNRDNGQCRAVLSGVQRAVVAVDFSPDGTLLAAGSEDGTVQIWDVQSGTLQQTLTMPRPYTGMEITGVQGLSAAQRRTLRILGAIERAPPKTGIAGDL
jgi:WD40 repeat protein